MDQRVGVTAMELWALRSDLEELDQLVAHPHSVISVLLPPKENLQIKITRLKKEYGKMVNPKTPPIFKYAEKGITWISDCLKDMRATPENGVAIYYASSVLNPRTGETRDIHRIIEPPFPIRDSLYYCDRFCVTAPLWKLLKVEQGSVGYVIVDGSQSTIAVVSEYERRIKLSEKVHLPRKHGRGGQSAARFGRLVQEARHLYIKDLSENVTLSLTQDDKPLVNALVVAGSGYLKDQLVDVLSPCLKQILKKVVSVAYGGLPGLNEAIEATRDILKDLSVQKSRTMLEQFFEHLKLGQDDMISYGEENVQSAVEAGVVKSVLVWDESPFMAWVMENCPQYKTEVQTVHNSFTESNMLIKSFSGVCALHRYSFRLPEPEDLLDDEAIDPVDLDY